MNGLKADQVFEAASLCVDGGVFDVADLGGVELGSVVGKVAIVDAKTDLEKQNRHFRKTFLVLLF